MSGSREPSPSTPARGMRRGMRSARSMRHAVRWRSMTTTSVAAVAMSHGSPGRVARSRAPARRGRRSSLVPSAGSTRRIRPRPASRTQSEPSLAATMSVARRPRAPPRGRPRAVQVVDPRDAVERVEAPVDPAAQRLRAARSATPTPAARSTAAWASASSSLARLGVAVDEVGALDALLDRGDELGRLGDRLAGDRRAGDGIGRARGRQAGDRDAHRQEPGHDRHADEPDPAAPSLLALRGARDAARVLRAAARDEGQDPGQERSGRRGPAADFAPSAASPA